MEKELEKLLEDYRFAFGDYPPMHIEIPYESPIYKKALEESLSTGKEITLDRLNEIADGESAERSAKEYDEKRLRNLLKTYGAKDDSIEDFVRDLYKKAPSTKADVYKAIKEKGGSDLIIKLASMPKEEREKAIADYLK